MISKCSSKRSSKPGNSSALWAARLCVVALISAGTGSSQTTPQPSAGQTLRSQQPCAPQSRSAIATGLRGAAVCYRSW